MTIKQISFPETSAKDIFMKVLRSEKIVTDFAGVEECVASLLVHAKTQKPYIRGRLKLRGYDHTWLLFFAWDSVKGTWCFSNDYADV